MSRLRFAQAKMQGDPAKVALKFLACLFTPEELVNGNPTGTTNSKDLRHQQTINKLDLGHLNYIQGTLYFVRILPYAIPALMFVYNASPLSILLCT